MLLALRSLFEAAAASTPLRQAYSFPAATNYNLVASSSISVSVQAGDLIIFGFTSNNTLNSVLASDSDGNAYSEVNGAGFYSSTAGMQTHVLYAFASATNATLRLAINSTGYGTPWFAVHVVKSPAGTLATVLDGAVQYSMPAAATSCSTSTFSTTNPNDYLFSMWVTDNYTGIGVTDTAGFAQELKASSDGASTWLYTSDKTVSATGTYGDSATLSGSSAYAVCVAAFKISMGSSLAASPYAIATTGQISPLAASLVAGAYGIAITGQATSLSIALAPTNGAIATTGTAPTLALSISLQCPTPYQVLTGEPVPSLSVALGAPAPYQVLTGEPVPSLGVALGTPTPSQALTGAPLPSRGQSVNAPAPYGITTTGTAPTAQFVLVPPAGAVATTGTVPTLVLGISLQCPTPTNVVIGASA